MSVNSVAGPKGAAAPALEKKDKAGESAGQSTEQSTAETGSKDISEFSTKSPGAEQLAQQNQARIAGNAVGVGGAVGNPGVGGIGGIGGPSKPDVTDLAERAWNAQTPEERDAIFREMVGRRSDLPPAEQEAALNNLAQTNAAKRNAENTHTKPLADQARALRQNNPPLAEFQDLPRDIENTQSRLEGSQWALERSSPENKAFWEGVVQRNQEDLTRQQQRLTELQADAQVQALDQQHKQLEAQRQAKYDQFVAPLAEQQNQIIDSLGVRDAGDRSMIPDAMGAAIPVDVVVTMVAREFGLPAEVPAVA